MPHESLADFPVIISVPLHWGEQDAFGHANNVNYFRWVETARIEYLMRVGAWERYERERVGPIVASLACDFRKPLTYPDSMLVGARIPEIGNSSFQMIHTVVSVGESVVVAEIRSTLVLIDYNTGKPVRVPEDLRDAIGRLERVKSAASRQA